MPPVTSGTKPVWMMPVRTDPDGRLHRRPNAGDRKLVLNRLASFLTGTPAVALVPATSVGEIITDPVVLRKRSVQLVGAEPV
jgi:hypothetical protein